MIKQLLSFCTILSLSAASLAITANDPDSIKLAEFNELEARIIQSAENKNASLQYMSALLLALEAGQSGDKAFANFANRQIGLATYCLNTTNLAPEREMARIKKELIVSNQDKFYYATFKSFKSQNTVYGAITTQPCTVKKDS